MNLKFTPAVNVHWILQFFFECFAARSFTQQFTVQMINFSPENNGFDVTYYS